MAQSPIAGSNALLYEAFYAQRFVPSLRDPGAFFLVVPSNVAKATSISSEQTSLFHCARTYYGVYLVRLSLLEESNSTFPTVILMICSRYLPFSIFYVFFDDVELDRKRSCRPKNQTMVHRLTFWCLISKYYSHWLTIKIEMNQSGQKIEG